MFAYLALSTLAFFSVILGWSQLLASQSPWGFFLIPVWVVIAVSLWIASQAGQQLSITEMQELRSLIEGVVRVCSSGHQELKPQHRQE